MSKMYNPSISVLLALVVTVLMSACNAAQFTVPMPPNKRDLTKIPLAFQGVWSDGETTITVQQTTFYHTDAEESMEVGPNFRVRKMAGQLVLSFPEDKGALDRWTVILADVINGNLILREFDPEDEHALAVWEEVLLDQGVHIVNENNETMILSPTKSEFKSLIRRGASTFLGEYHRVPKPSSPPPQSN
ncbi:MAG: hypothetical protein P8M07_03870 [Flavobacteriales bacterium]|nr:hypothetical protein [Flavobacteriales bacterium]